VKLINHRNQLDALPPTALKNCIATRYQDLVETEDDLPPIFVIVEEDDDITGPDYAFVSSNGLLGDDDQPYESITHLRDINTHELLLLLNGEDAYFIYVLDAASFGSPALVRLLNSSTTR
jgi:hypothetical protein